MKQKELAKALMIISNGKKPSGLHALYKIIYQHCKVNNVTASTHARHSANIGKMSLFVAWRSRSHHFMTNVDR